MRKEWVSRQSELLFALLGANPWSSPPLVPPNAEGVGFSGSRSAPALLDAIPGARRQADRRAESPNACDELTRVARWPIEMAHETLTTPSVTFS